jgi:hypothetical protein
MSDLRHQDSDKHQMALRHGGDEAQSDALARRKLLDSQVPERERFSSNMLSRMQHFLEAGYKIKEINEHITSGEATKNWYKTTLDFKGKTEEFRHEYPFSVQLMTKTSKEGQMLEYINLLMQKANY